MRIALGSIELGLLAAAGMFWNILWALILGFGLSGIVRVFVPRRKITRLLGKPGLPEILRATALGALSSSCSYAAAAMARRLFQKGAHIVPSLAFMLASTNLVIELSAVLWVLLGARFVAAEALGGLLMIAVMAALMLWIGPLPAFKERREKLNSQSPEMPESPQAPASIRSLDSWRAAARASVLEWKMIWKDIALGVLVSGFLMALVPDSFWQRLFLAKWANVPATHPEGFARLVENALLGPLVSVLSFTCSVGNIPMAAVLYRSGIGFGGTLSFIYADLIIFPLILVYARYYGWKLALRIVGILYASMAIAGIAVDRLFLLLGLEFPSRARALGHPFMAPGAAFLRIDATFWLNLAGLALAGAAIALARTRGAPAPTSCCGE